MEKYTKQRYGFSLLELIIVVLLISIATGLVINNIGTKKKTTNELTPLNLRENIVKLLGNGGEFFCISKCQECYYSNSAYKGQLRLGEIEAYILDESDNLQKIDFGRIDDEKVCLRYRVYPNHSSSKMVLKNNEGLYLLPSYFGKTQKVKDLQKAEELWLKDTDIASSQGDFY